MDFLRLGLNLDDLGSERFSWEACEDLIEHLSADPDSLFYQKEMGYTYQAGFVPLLLIQVMNMLGAKLPIPIPAERPLSEAETQAIMDWYSDNSSWK